jgi:hypothetical protein
MKRRFKRRLYRDRLFCLVAFSASSSKSKWTYASFAYKRGALIITCLPPEPEDALRH